MTTKIHHAVAKKAARLGITLTILADGHIQAADDASGDSYAAPNAADAVSLVEAARKRAAQDDPSAAVGDAKVKKASKKPRATKKAKAKKTRNAEDGDEDEEGEEKESRSVVAPKYKKKYRPHKDTCGDHFVDTMKTFLCPDGEDTDLGRLGRLLKDNGIDPQRWAGKNVGMRRMNAGNMLRAMIRNGKDVKIGNITIPGEKVAAKPSKPKKGKTSAEASA